MLPPYPGERESQVKVNSLSLVLTDIIGERQAQDAQWGGPAHDDHHAVLEWAGIIEHHLGRLGRELMPTPENGTRDDVRRTNAAVRRRLLVISSLGVAAMESIDRRTEQLEAEWAQQDAGAVNHVDDHD